MLSTEYSMWLEINLLKVGKRGKEAGTNCAFRLCSSTCPQASADVHGLTYCQNI